MEQKDGNNLQFPKHEVLARTEKYTTDTRTKGFEDNYF